MSNQVNLTLPGVLIREQRLYLLPDRPRFWIQTDTALRLSPEIRRIGLVTSGPYKRQM